MAVDGPAGRNDGLLVVHDHVTGLAGLTHHMEHSLVGGDVKVEVNLHAALVGMAGHGVPNIAGQQSGHAHAQLAAFAHGRMDILAQNALVDGLLAAQMVVASLVHGDMDGGAGAVGGAGIDVELGRICGVIGGEGQLLGAHADVDAVLAAHGVLGAVDDQLAGAAHIDGAQLSSGQEIGCGQFLAAFQHQITFHRHDAAGNDAVLVGIGQVHGICLKQVADMIVLAKLLGIVPFGVFGMVGITNIKFHIDTLLLC